MACEVCGRACSDRCKVIPFEGEELNSYFVNFVTDPTYHKEFVMCQLVNTEARKRNIDFYEWSEHTITEVLSKIKHTAPGSDDIPSWFYKIFASDIAPIVCKIFNTSVV